MTDHKEDFGISVTTIRKDLYQIRRTVVRGEVELTVGEPWVLNKKEVDLLLFKLKLLTKSLV